MGLLEVTGISLLEEGEQVLKDISFSQEEFQKIAIAGHTGSGKSTLLQTIAGLVQPTTGEVRLNGKKVIGPADKLVPGHPGIAYLSQHFELPPYVRVEQALRYSNALTGDEVETLLEVCRVSHLLTRKTNHLSGGERQRIAMAKLLISSPKLFLLDEPFSNLDLVHKQTLKAVIRDISDKLNITCVLVSHDPLDALSWADEIIILKEGQLVQKGTPEQIYRQPVDAYTASLFGSYNLVSAADAKAFSRLPGSSLNGKNLLIRPESFKVVAEQTEESEAVRGTVAHVNYFGSYYEIEVMVSKMQLTVRAETCRFAKGDTVYLSLKPEAVWHI